MVKPKPKPIVMRPTQALGASLNRKVRVVLSTGLVYTGLLDGYDPHLNIVLRRAQEWRGQQLVVRLERIILRGDNVIYVTS